MTAEDAPHKGLFFICHGADRDPVESRFVAQRTITTADRVLASMVLGLAGVGSAWLQRGWAGIQADPEMGLEELRERLGPWGEVKDGGARTPEEVTQKLGTEAVDLIFGYKTTEVVDTDLL